jgi:hypothetical protein
MLPVAASQIGATVVSIVRRGPPSARRWRILTSALSARQAWRASQTDLASSLLKQVATSTSRTSSDEMPRRDSNAGFIPSYANRPRRNGRTAKRRSAANIQYSRSLVSSGPIRSHSLTLARFDSQAGELCSFTIRTLSSQTTLDTESNIVSRFSRRHRGINPKTGSEAAPFGCVDYTPLGLSHHQVVFPQELNLESVRRNPEMHECAGREASFRERSSKVMQQILKVLQTGFREPLCFFERIHSR